MKNRREYRRWNCSFPCRFENGDIRFEGFVSNLSFNGACVEGQANLPLRGDALTLQIEADPEVSIPARVVYVIEQRGRERFGIEFSGTWEEKLQALMPLFERYVDQEDYSLPLLHSEEHDH